MQTNGLNHNLINQLEKDPSMQQIVVAALDITKGTIIEAHQIKLSYFPTGVIPKNRHLTIDQVTGLIANRDIYAGEMVLTPHVTNEPDGSLLSVLLEPNKRAMTVRVDDVIGVAGFLLPGNFVDVISVRKPDFNARAISETILEKIRVLAVDQKAVTEENEPIVVRSVTIEVDPKQAEKLVVAMTEGQIQLTLRNPNEEVVEKVAAQATPAPAVKKVVYKPVYKPAQQNNVEVIRGVTSEVKRVQNG